MRILWFTNTPSGYKQKAGGYNGGGWLSSLEEAMKGRPDITLGVSFHLGGEPAKVERGGVAYYPVAKPRRPKLLSLLRILRRYDERDDRELTARLMEVVADFRPDVIHVFGSEQAFGLVARHTQVPVVLHIQGILNPYLDAYLPPFCSWGSYLLHRGSLPAMTRAWVEKRAWERSCQRERLILHSVRHYIGRTAWDERVTRTLSPGCSYRYGGEILRAVFYEPRPRRQPEEALFVTTLSNPPYKGFDVVLKAARILKQELRLGFRWVVFGNVDPAPAERMTGIAHRDVHIELKGVAGAEEIRECLTECTAFVHPSYIDNSPNSVCEAQLAGCPVVATYVGGVPSLIADGQDGFLTPANDPYQTAWLAALLHRDRELNRTMGRNARATALKRHDRDEITARLAETYRTLIHETPHTP